jgi:hypothetical protein
MNKKKTVRVAATAVTGIAAGLATAFPAGAPAQAATRSYEVRILASPSVAAAEANNGSTIQVCGHNQSNSPKCRFTTAGAVNSHTGQRSFYTPNWWWIGPITIWFNHHHSRSNAGCNTQHMSKSTAGFYALGNASFGNHNCS